VTIEGTVTDVFGNRFILQNPSGRTLVHGGPERHQRLDIRPEAAGYRVQGQPEAHRRHYEVIALNPRGERVKVHVDFAGQVYRETWDRGRGFGDRPEEAEARRMAEAAGFRIVGPMLAHPRHYEAEAVAADGRRVRLHIHAEGVRHANALR
jgi:hypothetical protein